VLRDRGIGGAWRHDDQSDFLSLGLHCVPNLRRWGSACALTGIAYEHGQLSRLGRVCLERIYAFIVRGELVQQEGFSSSIWAHDRDDDLQYSVESQFEAALIFNFPKKEQQLGGVVQTNT
jgi:hypothetical protein